MSAGAVVTLVALGLLGVDVGRNHGYLDAITTVVCAVAALIHFKGMAETVAACILRGRK